jgi:deoxyuridine 5'-triphosphate nucleotidohydrolase
MKVFKIRDTAEIPSYATQGSACFDVKACLEIGSTLKCYTPFNKQVPIYPKIIGGSGQIGITVPPAARVLIPTGLIFDIPKDHMMEMFIRSSVATKKGLVLVNSVGIIDSDYVDETHIIVHNMSDTIVIVSHGDRLAQCKISKVQQAELTERKTAPKTKTDRKGGIGSTGV